MFLNNLKYLKFLKIFHGFFLKNAKSISEINFGDLCAFKNTDI